MTRKIIAEKAHEYNMLRISELEMEVEALEAQVVKLQAGAIVSISRIYHMGAPAAGIWQPMFTAPKDGRPILVMYKGGVPYVVRWLEWQTGGDDMNGDPPEYASGWCINGAEDTWLTDDPEAWAFIHHGQVKEAVGRGSPNELAKAVKEGQ